MTSTKYAFIFPGQGESHSVGMAKDFYDEYEIVRQTFNEASEITGVDLQDLIFNGPLEKLSQTDHCQLAIYVVSIAIWRALKLEHPNLEPHCVAGLSLGEYSAATAAGVLSFEQGVRLVHARGTYMQKACNENPSTMAVVLGMDEPSIREVLKTSSYADEIWVANLNCPGQIVVSGSHRAIEDFIPKAKEAKAKRALPLNVAGAFHTPFMKLAANELSTLLDQMPLSAPQVPFFMNSVGQQVDALEEVKELLIKQITTSVRWQSCIEKIQEKGVTTYLELGPGKVLAGLNKRIKVQGRTLSINTVEDLKSFEVCETTQS